MGEPSLSIHIGRGFTFGPSNESTPMTTQTNNLHAPGGNLLVATKSSAAPHQHADQIAVVTAAATVATSASRARAARRVVGVVVGAIVAFFVFGLVSIAQGYESERDIVVEANGVAVLHEIVAAKETTWVALADSGLDQDQLVADLVAIAKSTEGERNSQLDIVVYDDARDLDLITDGYRITNTLDPSHEASIDALVDVGRSIDTDWLEAHFVASASIEDGGSTLVICFADPLGTCRTSFADEVVELYS